MRMKLFFLTGIALAASVQPTLAATQKIRRFAFVVGKNQGGQERVPLKYAATDAQAFTKVMEELGGLDDRDAILLLNPSRKDFLSRFQDVQTIIGKAKTKDTRTELFLYYSGHSDHEGLLLDGEKVSYPELKKEIARVSADLSVVILDSCASGSLTRVKGGMRKAPFLEDSLSKLKGYVVLTSSSAQEASQESDRVKGSYFTHYLVSGVRGAADVNVDHRVTLNEAYQYAFHQTLARTEKTMAGPQHPSYSIELAGSGELVMTDIRNTNSRIVLEDKLLGRFYIRNQDEKLVAEVEKQLPKEVSVGLEPGSYTITSSRGGKIAAASAKVGPNHAFLVTQTDFRSQEAEVAALRGDHPAEESADEEELVVVPAEFSVMPGVSTNILEQDRSINYFHMSLLYAKSARLRGSSISILGVSRARKSVTGAQISTAANWVDSGPMTGAQISVGYNRADEVTGVQMSSGYNQAGRMTGYQGGLLNIADSVVGSQMGLANFSYHTVEGAQLGLFNRAADPVTGVQMALWNESRSRIAGTQIGLGNIAQRIDGVQLGLVNIADDVSGVQFGLINKSSGKTGLPIGLVNLVAEESVTRIGYAFNEKSFHQLQLRHGTKNSYSILQYGRRFASTSPGQYDLLGFGLGGQWMNERFFVGAEGIFNYVNRVGQSLTKSAGLTQIRLLPGWRMTPRVSITVGPTLNHVFGDESRTHTFSERRFWMGYHAGLEYWI